MAKLNQARARSWVPVIGVLGASLVMTFRPILLAESAAQPWLSAAMVAACMVLSSMINARLGPASIAAGSLAALAILGPLRHQPALAGALFLLALHVPRALRAQYTLGGVAALVLSAGAGWAATLISPYGAQGLTGSFAVISVASVLAALPLLVSVDDFVGVAVRRAANQTRGSQRFGLLRAVALRRAWHDASIPADVRRTLEGAWRQLATMAIEERNGAAAAHARALSRAHRAARALGKARRAVDERDLISEAEERLAAELSVLHEIQQAV